MSLDARTTAKASYPAAILAAIITDVASPFGWHDEDGADYLEFRARKSLGFQPAIQSYLAPSFLLVFEQVIYLHLIQKNAIRMQILNLRHQPGLLSRLIQPSGRILVKYCKIVAKVCARTQTMLRKDGML